VRENAIVDVTETGVQLADGTVHDVDVIVFATGFDALTGALTRIDIRGRGGVSIAEKWADGPRTHLATTVDEFPNLFMIAGPQIPFANAPVMIEPTAVAIGEAISKANAQGNTRIEVKPEAVEEYDQLLHLFYNATIFPAGAKLRAWWLGTNVEGKKLGVAMNFGGFPNFVASVRAEAAGGFEHYEFTGGEQSLAAAGSRSA
jgi:cyclohexanone monooxygenase